MLLYVVYRCRDRASSLQLVMFEVWGRHGVTNATLDSYMIELVSMCNERQTKGKTTNAPT